MRRFLAILLMMLPLVLLAPEARAVIACNASVTDVVTSFNPAVGASLTGSYTVTCTRAGGDPSTQDYSLGLNGGLYSSGGFPPNKRVKRTVSNNYYNYDTYRDDGQEWWNFIFGIGRIQGTVNFGGLMVGSANGIFEVRAAAQTAGPAGTYVDTLTWTLYNSATGGTAFSNGTFNVIFITNATCSLTPPTSLTFSYTSFQGAAALASANFNVTCTSLLPYTLSLDNAGPITDNALNLTYSLSLSAPGGTGSGAAQTYSVNGTMAAGQAGKCAAASCTNAASTNKTRTLTVTY